MSIHPLGTMNVCINLVPFHPVDVEIFHWINENFGDSLTFHRASVVGQSHLNSSSDYTYTVPNFILIHPTRYFSRAKWWYLQENIVLDNEVHY